MPVKHEAKLQTQLAQYLRIEYPRVIFRSDFAAGIRMTMGQATQHKRMQQGKSYPDFFVAYANRGYHGLFLELKHPGSDHLPYLKDGRISRDQHVQQQAEVLQELTNQGYYARFAVGYNQAVAIIDWYLLLKGHRPTEPPHDNGNEVAMARQLKPPRRRKPATDSELPF